MTKQTFLLCFFLIEITSGGAIQAASTPFLEQQAAVYRQLPLKQQSKYGHCPSDVPKQGLYPSAL